MCACARNIVLWEAPFFSMCACERFLMIKSSHTQIGKLELAVGA